MKGFFEKRKRNIAAMLVVVLTLQTILISGPLSLTTVHAGVKNRVDLTTGEPEPGAFRELYVETGTVVSGDGDKLSMRFGFRLDDEWLEGKLYEYIDAGILKDPGDFASLQEYDDYLEGVEDERFAPLAFTCTVNDGVLDVPQIQAYLEGNREIYTVRNEKIGAWEVENSSKGPIFKIFFDKKVYSRSNVVGNRGLEAQLLERFQQGDTVDSGKGSGGVDLSIHINGTGEPVATSSDYIMEKTAESGDEARNADDETDPSAINFLVSVRANASNAKNPLEASASNWQTLASPDGASRSFASVSEPDDGIPLDERDGELIFDWWNFSAPVKSRYVRPADEGDPGFDLSGKFVVDSISSALNLDAVEISINGRSWERLGVQEIVGYESWEEYLAENDRLFSYQIPSAEEGTVTEFNIRFYTRIADRLWAEYGKYGVLEREFPNKAILKGEDGTTTLTVSNQVKPSVHWESLIEKNGLPLDVNGDMYQWEIHVDAHFSAGVNLYLIDHIEDTENTHHYVLDDPENHPVRMESAGKLDKTFEVVKLREEELGSITDKDFENLSINDIEVLLGKGDRFHDGIVYVYERTDAESGKTDQFMLIPMNGYTNGKSTIYYETDVRASKDQGSLEYEAQLGNEVKPVWKWDGGLSPGDMPFGEITVGKTYPIQVNVVNKKAAGYHPESNAISWEFDVNQRGVKLDRVLITDDLDDVAGGQKLEWLDLGEGMEISLVHTDRRPAAQRSLADDRSVSYVSPEIWNKRVNMEDAKADAPGNYYTIDGAKLKIRLDGMEAEDYYKFTVDTRILDGNYAQDGKWTIENTASVVATSNGKNSEPKKIEAETEIEHNLISKYVEPFGKETGKSYFYNFAENSVQWRIKVNPDGRTIKDAVITDTLPLGTVFDRIISASRGGVEGAVNSGADGISIDFGDGSLIRLEAKHDSKPYPETGSGSYSADTIRFHFPGEIRETYEFVFTTVVEESFRREIIKSADKDGEPLLNQANLTGKIDGVEITGAHVEAVNRIMPQPLRKEGSYHGLSDYIYFDDDSPDGRKIQMVWLNWTAYVNRTNVDMKGAEVWDALEECFELIPASVNIDVVSLDEEGDIADGTAIDRIVEKGKAVPGKTALDGWTADDRGFRFTIPEQYKKDTLRITFDTALVDDAAASQMTNTIHAKGNGWEDSSAEASDDNSEDFRLEDYATAEGMIFLRVLKSSENNNTGPLYLKGAEFSLQKLKLTEGGNKKSLEDWKVTGSKKVRTTRSNGALSYLFLQPDVMYRLEETAAPTGYKKIDKTWNIVAKLDKSSIEDYPDTILTGDMEVIINQEREKNSLDCTVNNKPDVKGGTNELRFVKTGQNGQILPGTVFTLKSSHQSWTATADEMGVVSFKPLDPLEEGQLYTLRETKPVGYERLPAYYVSVTVDEHGVYDLKLLNEKKEEIADRREDPHNTEKPQKQIYEVKNKAIRKSGSFAKVDQNGGMLGSEAVSFEIYRRGDGGKKTAGEEEHTIDIHSADTNYYPYLPDSNQPLTVTSVDGIVTLDKLYFGYYKLVEKNLPAASGILKPDSPVTVYIKVDERGIKALPADVAKPEEALDSQYTKILDGKTSPQSLTVQNSLKWGFVQVNKVLGTYNGTGWEPEEKEGAKIPLAGVLFGVYRKGASGGPGELYMRLKTGADGTFLMDGNDRSRYQIFDESGNMAGTKALLCGAYYLKEISAPEKYAANQTPYPFTITPGTGDTEGDYQASAAVYIDSEAAAPEQAASGNKNSCFLNKPVRHLVELVKADADFAEIRLDHAQFHIFVKEGNVEFAVAELNSVGAEGKYQLAPVRSSGCETCSEGTRKQNGRGEKYLEQAPPAGGLNAAQYLLLPGDYTIRETQAPYITSGDNLYPLDSAKMYAALTVTTKGVSIASGGGTLNPSGLTVKNRVKHGSVEVSKRIMVLKDLGQADGAYEYAEASGFTFRLSGNPAHDPAKDSAPAGRKTWTAATDEDGTIVFENVPVGIYKLEEWDVPAKYKDVNGNWLVDRAPTAWVKIEPVAGNAAEDGVTVSYYSVGADGKPGDALEQRKTEPVSQNASGIYLKPDIPASGVEVYNALKLANIEGTKLAVSGKQTAPLPGAEFSLTHRTLAKEGKPYTYQAKTEEDGSLRFTDVPYGTYTLKETGTPAGFEKMPGLEITLSDGSLDADSGTYWLNDAGGNTLLRNQVAVVNARFQKLDQNGDKIPHSKLNARFTVEKLRSAVAGKDFWPEGGAVVPTDENGYLEIDNLSYGVYKVQETLTEEEREKLDSGSALAVFWLEVKASPETGKAEVCIYGEEPSADGLSGFLNSLLRINSLLAAITVPAGGSADFTDADQFEKVARRMTNVWKYGGIQLHKVGGDAAGESGHEVTSDLEGVTFAIYKKGESTPYLTLQTEAHGRLPAMDSDGKYKDAETGERKILLAGEYTLKEISTREGYQTYTEPIDFAVTDRSETIFFGYDGKTVSAKPLDAATGKDIKFYNIPERGKLEFIKKDSETGKALDGAVFLAFTDEAQTEPVAFVGQMAAGKTYEIIGNREQISVLKNRYRDEIAGWNDRIGGVAAVSGNDQDGYALKTGDYYLKEIEAPKNYSLPAGSVNSVKVTVEAGQTVQVQSGMVGGAAEGGVVANTVAKASLLFTKKIETSDYRPDDVPKGLRFVLRGTSSNGAANEVWTASAVSGADGGFSFPDVPAGSYVLYECDEEHDTHTDPYVGFRPGTEDEVAVLHVLVEAEGDSAKVTCTKVGDSPADVNGAGTEITNKLKLGSIAGKKVSAGNQPVGLKDAVFGIFLSREDAIQGSSPVKTVRSGEDGGFLFENVPYGVYYIKEQEAPYGYVPVTTVFKVTIGEAGLEAVRQGIDVETDEASTDMKDIVFVNENKRGTILLEKKASLTGTVLTDAVFTVYASYADGILEAPAAYLTYQDGVYKLSDGDGLIGQPAGHVPYLQKDEHGAYNLIQGHYWVAETKVPDGYRKEMDGGEQRVYPVTISSSSTEQQIPAVAITNDAEKTAFYNELMTGGFTIQKTVETAGPGDEKPGVIQEGRGFKFRIEGITTEAASKGTPVSQIGTLRIDGMQAGNAANAEVDGDAILVTTGADGTAEVSGLPIGMYTVTETDGPKMELYTEIAPKAVAISPNDSQTGLEIRFDGEKAGTKEAVLSFHNELKRYRVEGKKTDDKGAALAGAVFGLYSEDGQRLYHTAKADRNGIFAFENLTPGMYMVKEIAPPGEEYLVDDTEYPVAVTTGMDPADTIMVSDSPIVNVLIKSAIEGQKVTSEGKPLPGAVIGLFLADTGSFTEENLFHGMRAVSGADGKFLFENVPYGVYRIAELQAPSGYNLNSQTSYLVKVETHGTVVTAGIREEKGAAAAVDVTAIRIENKKKSSGSGGSSGNSNQNLKPADPTAPANLGPGVLPTEPGDLILPTTEPTEEVWPTIPFDPSHPVISIPGDPHRVEIVDENDIQVYEGPGRDIHIGDWEPGNYTVYTFDDQDVPLGAMVFTIDEEGVPLAFMLPKTGDSSLPYALLATIMLGAAGGIGGLVWRRKRRGTRADPGQD